MEKLPRKPRKGYNYRVIGYSNSGVNIDHHDAHTLEHAILIRQYMLGLRAQSRFKKSDHVEIYNRVGAKVELSAELRNLWLG